MNRAFPMKTIVSKDIGKNARVCIADLYPAAGIFGIAVYIVVECILG